MAPTRDALPPLEWEAAEARHWIAHEDRYLRMLSGLGRRVLEAAAIRPDSQVLEIGCGYGGLTLLAADAATDGHVLALDISEPMLERARQRQTAAGARNVAFWLGDAQTAALPRSRFDVVISRLGVMFFADPAAAFANIRRAVRPGGRLAFVCWRDVFENEHMTVPLGAVLPHIPRPDLGNPQALGPFSMADPDRLRTMLHDAGWADVVIEPFSEQMWWGTDAQDVAEFIRGTGRAQILVRNVADDVIERAFAALCEALTAHESPDGVHLGGAGWLVTARQPDHPPLGGHAEEVGGG